MLLSTHGHFASTKYLDRSLFVHVPPLLTYFCTCCSTILLSRVKLRLLTQGKPRLNLACVCVCVLCVCVCCVCVCVCVCCMSYCIDLLNLFRYTGAAWIDELVIGGGTGWEVRVKGNFSPRADNGRINTSPTTAISPIVRLRHGVTHTISIPGKEAVADSPLHEHKRNTYLVAIIYLPMWFFLYIYVDVQHYTYSHIHAYLCVLWYLQ